VLLLLLLLSLLLRFDGLSGALPDGMPRMEVPAEVLDSIRKNKVRRLLMLLCNDYRCVR
jgi:hypothetical protein